MSISVKPYNADEGKKVQVERMFDRVAPTYDLLNRVLSLGIDVSWRKKALRKLQSLQPRQMLDVATGTADVAILSAQLLQPEQIVGLDISQQMLEIGRQKILNRHLDHLITLETGDSENLRFANDTFDAVTVAFGVRNFENLEKGLAEILRVLRPGGRAVILEFSRPRFFPFNQIYYGYFKYVLPLIGRFTSRDARAYQYLFESVQAFPEGNSFTDILITVGFRNPQLERLTLGICTIYTAEK